MIRVQGLAALRSGANAATERTRVAAQDVLEGRSGGWRALLPFAGPAFVASVAYVDPGNFATNVQGGANFGYRLLWVVVLANLMAMLFQGLSAKLGVVTGKNLAELCRERLPRPATLSMWVVSEIGAMATDVAEFLGATIALNLLCGVPMLTAVLLTGLLTYALLMLDRYGFRPLEVLVGSLVGVIAVAYVIETLLAKPNWSQVAYHSVVPWIGGSSSLLLAVGIVGATVMPHAIYLHSGLTQDRIRHDSVATARRIIRYSNIEVVIALGLAGLVNLAMMFMSAAVFNAHGRADVADISTAYRTLTPLLGGAAAFVFLISLLASGVSSSVVGTMAGQVIMQGFVGFTVPIWLRRLVTMTPAVVVVALGVNVTEALVLSQVVLSFVLPVPIIALMYFTSRSQTMGVLANAKPVMVLAALASFTILVLNALLLWTTFGGSLPKLG